MLELFLQRTGKNKYIKCRNPTPNKNKKSDEESCMPVIQSLPSQFLTTSFRSWPAVWIIAAPESYNCKNYHEHIGANTSRSRWKVTITFLMDIMNQTFFFFFWSNENFIIYLFIFWWHSRTSVRLVVRHRTYFTTILTINQTSTGNWSHPPKPIAG